MKKILALILSLILMMSFAAFAEEELTVEDAYEGVWMQFPDDGFEMYLPAEWLELELEEMTTEESGIYYAIASPDGAMTFQLAWAQLETEMDNAAMLADIQTVYPEAQLLTVGANEVVCYADSDADILAFAMLDTIDLGVYYFNFTPASNEEAVAYATVMMASVSPIEVETEEAA